MLRRPLAQERSFPIVNLEMVLPNGEDLANDQSLVVVLEVHGHKGTDFKSGMEIVNHLSWCFSFPWVSVASSVYLEIY